MKHLTLIITTAGLLNLPGLVAASPVPTVEVGGVSFAERILVQQAELRLTGAAVLRWALLVDVYAGAFYLPPGVAGDNWSADVPKRLELSYFRSFKAEDFSSASDKLLRDALTEEAYQALAPRLQQFNRLYRDSRTGDRYSLSYHPATGTELRFNDQLLGAAPGADFAVAYFGLWLGPKPISESFRDQLLRGGS